MAKPQSIEVKCEALRGMPTGIVNYFLEIYPSIPPKAEYVLLMVRPEELGLQRGVNYRVTFEEIDDPGD